MTATDLLTRVASAGITLRVEDGALRFRAPKGALTEDLRAELAARRDELIQLLTDAAAMTDDDREPPLPFTAMLPDEIPIAPGQARWWFLDQLGAPAESAAIAAALDLIGPLDTGRLAAAFAAIVARHEPLRTALVGHDGAPRAVLHPAPAHWPLPVIDAADDAAADLIARAEAGRRFELATGPLLRTVLIRVAGDPGRHRLVVVLHHAAADGWSLGVLVRELAALYRSETLPALPLRYADAARDQARISARDLAYWRHHLDGLPPPEPMSFAADPDARSALDGDPVVRHDLPAATVARLEALGRAQGVTAFMILSAAVQILLARLSGQVDFAIGTPVAGRDRPALEPLVGFLVNTVVLRSSLTAAGDQAAPRQLLAAVRSDTLAALAHQSLPFDRLVDALAIPRSGTDNPLFRVLVAVQNAAIPDLVLDGLTVIPRPAPLSATRLDLEIYGDASPGRFGLTITHNPAVIGPQAARMLIDRLALVLEAIAADPDQPWTAIPLLTTAEAARIDRASRGAVIRHPHVPDEILSRLVEAPDAPALADLTGTLSRADLLSRARHLAAQLGDDVRGRPVGLMAGRGVDHGVGLLAIWLAGAGVMPLDDDLPDSRLQIMLTIAEPAALITTAALRPRLTAIAGPVPVLVPDAKSAAMPADTGGAIITTPDSLAYLLFTSGSTGTPKAVAVAWRTLDQLAGWHRARHPEPARTLGFAPTGFDVSLQEAAIAWAEGGCWIVACDATRRDPAALARFIRDHRITRLFLPVVMLHALADHLAGHPDHIPDSVTTVITAGEQLRITPAVRAWCRRSPFRLDNQYGPTETHVVAAELLAADDVDHWPDRPPIGRPVDGAVLHVTDAQGRVLPDGVAGELRVGGTAPAIGYHRDPDRTAERFVTGPDGGRVYCTGDRVRRLADGRLAYLGRADDQVKIRGVRVEPGEIEAALGTHPDVAQALVVVRAIAGAATLVAHVEPRVMPADDAALADALRGHLRARLPDPMIPARWVIAPALPRSANGKLDRRALPDTDGLTLAGAAASVPPATDTEIALATLWAEVLGIDTGGIHAGDDFFALGGHSLRATQLVARIARDLAVDLAVARIFEAPVLADLAAVIDQAGGVARAVHQPIPRSMADDAEGSTWPLSFAQERLWFIDQLSPARGAYNMPAAIRLTGRLDVAALARSFAAITRRHAVLRSAILDHDGHPVQQIMPAPADWALPVEDLSHLAPGPQHDAVSRRAVEDAETPFDLSQPLKLRTRLIRLAPDAHVLLATLHHIASDGWSIGVLVRELATLYAAFSTGRPDPLPPLPVAYADVAVWQRQRLTGAVLAGHLDYWRRQLDDLTSPALATDRPRPAVQSYQGALTRRPLPQAVSAAVDAAARRHRATPFVVLLAAFQTLIGRMAGTSDVAVGAPIANRTHPDTEGLIGFFVNALVLRSRFADDPDFATLIDRVRMTVLDAQAHQDLPFELLVEALEPDRALDRNPLFQIAFAVQNADMPPLALDGLEIRTVDREVTRTRFDLELHVWPAPHGYDLVAYYATDLFDQAGIDRLLARYETLLDAALDAPHTRLSALPATTDDEAAAIARLSHGPVPQPATDVVTLIAAAAAADPDAAAILHGDGPAISRAALATASDRLAARLRAAGLAPEGRVGLLFDRSPAMVVAALAVMKAGGAYVPMDTRYPDDRIIWQAANAGMALILAAPDQAARAAAAGRVLTVTDPGQDDDDDDAPRNAATQARAAAAPHPDHLAYVVYTSGSTGTPKGVAVSHGGLANLIAWHRRAYAPDATTRMAQVAGLAFDAAVWEIWPALAAGATLVLPAPDATRDPDLLLAAFIHHGVTQAFVPTPLAGPLLAGPRPAGLALDLLLTGGERLAAAPRMAGVRLVNHYGPTETAVVATAGDIDPTDILAGRAPSIGQPIDGFIAHVLDRHMRPVGFGVAGELCLGGAGLARGYLGRPDLTAAAFVPDPLSDTPGARLYRTGDMVVRRMDGRLDFIGRADAQVKLRGHRIEPGEIETALRDDPAVQAAVVVLAQAAQTGQAADRLVAFVVADDAAAAQAETDRAAREAERAEEWRSLYADTYGAPDDDDPLFRIGGWTSSYDRQPIPAACMAAWRDATVARIAALGADALWEIGCGSGLLLWTLAGRMRRYHATDFSGEAVERLAVETAARGLDHVSLERRAADDMDGRPAGPGADGRWPAIVINSVIQYFPGEDYLLRVIRGALDALEPGGRLFIGDIRAAHVEAGFQTSIALHQAPATTEADAVAARVADALAAEKELLVDPSWFRALPDRLAGIAAVEIRLKRGRDRTEMTRFRYDVIIHAQAAGPAPAPLTLDRTLDWASTGMAGFAAACTAIASGEARAIEIRDLPNARVAADMAAAARLSAGAAASAAAIAAGAAADAAEAVDPEALWAEAEAAGLTLHVTWAADPAHMHVLITRPDAGSGADNAGPIWQPADPLPAGPLPDRPLITDPLRAGAGRRLAARLRDRLRRRLPDAMVPAEIITLPALPLTPNGKVDRKALIARLKRQAGAAATPATKTVDGATEHLLARIWCEVLALDQIGRDDNFFESGGDSILSIQVAARARKAGLVLAVRDLFEYQTIARLAAALDARLPADTGHAASRPVDGPVPLAAIQSWFFDRATGDPHHFNQAILLTLPPALADARIARALERVARRHDALRLRFTTDATGCMSMQAGTIDGAIGFETVDLGSHDTAARRDAALTTHAAATQARLDLAAGPLLRVVRYVMAPPGRQADGAHPPQADRLLIVAHHLVIDAVSWRLLLDDLRDDLDRPDTTDGDASRDDAPPAFTRWASALAARAADGAFDDEAGHWRALALAARADPVALPVDDATAPDRVMDARATLRVLDEARTASALRAANRAWRTDTADLLAAAAARALARLMGRTAGGGPVGVLIDREGHGREDLVPGFDPSRIIGWFTAIHPVRLTADPDEPPIATLRRVKDTLRAIPRRGAGFGPLVRAGRLPAAALPPTPEIAFNYLGQVDAALAADSAFGAAPEAIGDLQAPTSRRTHALTIGAAVMDGALRIEVIWPGARMAATRMEAFADDLLAQLRAVIDACMADSTGGLTPSDLPLAGLDQTAIDNLLVALPVHAASIDTVYPATPLQHGLLLKGLGAEGLGGDGLYVEQFRFRIQAPVDAAALADAWAIAADRHEALRSLIAHRGLERPLIVVLKRGATALDIVDHRPLAPDAAEAAIDDACAADRRRGFAADRRPPWRLALHQLPGGDAVLAWTFHHALLDGWSTFRLLEEVLATYDARVAGRVPDLPPAPPLRLFAAWQAGRDPLGDETFWRAALDGLPPPQPLPAARPDGRETADRAHVTTRLAVADAAKLRDTAQLLRVTPATIAQAAWALVLARHGDRNDVVFGATVSGRPDAVADVERMVGLFINTIAIRVAVDPRARIGDWLAGLQAARIAAHPFEAAPLAHIQRWAGRDAATQPLFDSLMAFENYPIAEALRGRGGAADGRGPALTVTDSRYDGRTQYPLTVTILPADGFTIDIAYDPGRIDAAGADRLLCQMVRAVTGLVRDPQARLATIDVVDAAEHALIAAWSRGQGEAAEAAGLDMCPDATAASPDLPLHLRMATHAPDDVVIRHGTRTIDRAALDLAARRIARRLADAGIGAGDRVALLMARGPELVAAMLGVHHAGAAYLPLDPVYPDARINTVLAHAAPRAVIGDRPSLDRLNAMDAAPLLHIDATATTASGDAIDPPASPEPGWRDRPAYIIYTSGSTGTPKGVVVSQGNLARLIDATQGWFGFGAGDVWSLFHSPAFDFSVWEIWGPLATGGRLVIVGHDQARDPAGFRRLLAAERVTVLNQTPSAFGMLDAADSAAIADGGGALDALRLVIFGGEALDAATLSPWFARHGDARPVLVNMYGITETTVHVTAARIRAGHATETGTAPIGVPIPDLSLHLLDSTGRPVPLGATGEIHVGGAGLAQGYLGRPDLTAERFITTADGMRLYRSGDLGRWRGDGRLDHLGRIDAQMKIRGFRIEPAEIRAALISHPAIADAAVAIRSPAGTGSPILVAWIVVDGESGSGPDDSALRAHLKNRLPDWMLPQAVMPVPSLPLTANGKLNLKALPDPDITQATGRGGAPETATEIALARIWSDVLGISGIGRGDDFFALGGHSLLVARVAHRVAAGLGVTLDWPALFNAPTLDALARTIDATAEDGAPAVPAPVAVPRDGRPLPLTRAQRRMLFLNDAEPGPAHTIPLLLRLCGTLDTAALRRALEGLVHRHEALRTRFPLVDGQPVQTIDPPGFRPLPLIDLVALTPSERDAARRQIVDEALSQPFDLGRGPVFRTQLMRLADDDHLLVASLHHIAGDGWSVGVLARDLGALYRAASTGTAADLPALSLSAADLGTAEALPGMAARMAAALDTRAASLTAVPALDLVHDRPRPPRWSGAGATIRFRIDAATANAARHLATRLDTTPAVVLLSAHAALLGGLSGSTDFAIGLPAAERLRPETADIAALLVETLVVRANLAGITGAGLIRRMATEMRAVLAARPLPVDMLVERLALPRDGGRTPLFQTMFSHDRASDHRLDLGTGLTGRLDAAHTSGARTDLSLMLADSTDGGLDGLIEYATDLFDADIATRIAARYTRLLAALLADPARPVAGLPLVLPDETAWISGPASMAGDGAGDIATILRGHAMAAPRRIAICHGAQTVDYAELVARGEALAAALAGSGIAPGARVGLYAERSIAGVVATVAVMLAGATSVPIDPAYPAGRQAIIAGDAQLDALILMDGADMPGWAAVALPIIRIGADGRPRGAVETTTAARPATCGAAALAQILFTSGSTGRPKAIGVPWSAVLVRVAGGGGYTDITADSIIAHLANPSFDAASFEIWGALLNGGRLHIIDQPVLADPALLGPALTQGGVDLIFITTALFNRIAELAPDTFSSLRHLLLGGEAAQIRWVRAVARSCPDTRISNIYGPTETTVFATVHHVTAADLAAGAVPIGRPIAGTTAHVLDSGLRPLPPGVPGMLYLGGDGLTAGYLTDPGRTAASFIPDPFSPRPGGRLYRTGDIVRRDHNGAMHFMRRGDGQMKLRGHRIEPGEIEAAALALAEVRQAHVRLLRDDDTADARLVLYLTGTVSAPDVLADLRRQLPRWMVPSAAMVLDALPLTANGKIDGSRLPVPAPSTVAAPATATAIADDTTARVLQVWTELLGHGEIAPDDNFFDVGGHSLLLVDLRARLDMAFGITLAMTDFFACPTIQSQASLIARRLGRAATGVEPGPTPPSPAAGDGRIEGRGRQTAAAARRRRLTT